MCFKRTIRTKTNVDVGKIKQAFFYINLKQIWLFLMVVVFSFPLKVI